MSDVASPAPKRQLAKEGERCTSCAAFWQGQNQPPRILVGINKSTDSGIRIYVCPYCDGAPIIHNNHHNAD